jgi:GDP-L-fucose synthase
MSRALPRAHRIFVAGHRGLVGSAITRALQARGHDNLALRSHAELDLTDPVRVSRFFAETRPETVVLAAAKVGGIHANNTFPADFIRENLLIQTNVISEAWKHDVSRLLFLGSSCIYPRDCPQPMREEYLLTGPLEPTNRPYALAKIAGIELCWSLNRQYGMRFLSVMPTNLYGPNDNYDLTTSHVLPALIRKAHEAKVRRESEITLWGTGVPRREFLHSEDLAEACLFLLGLDDRAFDALCLPSEGPPLVNVGWGKDLSILQLAELVMDVVGFDGALKWDSAMPDGTPQKLLETSKMIGLGWQPRIPLREGITAAYVDFLRGPHSKSVAVS